MGRVIFLAGAALISIGCAEAARPPRAAPLTQDLEAWVAAEASGPAALWALAAPGARRVAAAPSQARDDGPELRYATRRIAPVVDAPPRPRRQGRVDVSFQGADMVQAFQFLADAGRFNLITAEGLSGKVSATLRGVDPYDALVSLAEANGATVQFDRQIVVVKKR